MFRNEGPHRVRRAARAACSALLVWGLWAAATAHAAELPRLLVLPVKALDEAAEKANGRFSALLSDELNARDTDFRRVAPRPAKPGPGAREATEAFTLARRKLSDLQFGPAVTAYARGLELMLGDPANADFDAVREAYIGLAVARFRMGQEREAVAALGELARLFPTYQLPTGRYPPVFVSAFNKARQAEGRATRATLKVDGPGDWTVQVDGRAPVKLPASVGNLRQGPHYLRAEGPGGERIGQTVTVSGATAEVLVDPVVLAAPPEATATVDAEAQAKLDAYARVMNADFVLVPVLYRAGENTLAVGTALYSTRAKGFNVFPPARFDQSLAGANVEVFKLVDRVSGAMRQFGAVAALPLDVTGRPKAPPAPVVADAREPKLTPPPLVTPAKPQPGVTATAKEPAKGPALWAGVPWYVWVAGGAAAVAVAGGTAYGISQATRPATGTVTATW
ncbi:MAG TPA: hypothetical protein VK447_01210 [Myxococcaceae bacterium]|nr:hypothetical protein [Myxococcaceae bacterium]